MATFTKQDFSDYGDQIASAFIYDHIPLEETIHKIATDHSLNPVQIKQLVWSANTKTHLALFEKKAGDKIIDFPLAEAWNVISRIYGDDTGESVKTASAEDYSPSTLADFYSPLQREKVAEDLSLVAVINGPKGSSDRIPRKIASANLTMRKLATEVKSQVIQAVIEYEDSVTAIRDRLRKYAQHPDTSQADWQALQSNAASALGKYRSNVLRDVGLVDPGVQVKTAEVYDADGLFIKDLQTVEANFNATIKLAKSLAHLFSIYPDTKS